MVEGDVWEQFLAGTELRKKQQLAFRESLTETQVGLLLARLEEWPDRRALLKLGLTSEEMRQFWSHRGDAELIALAEVVKSFRSASHFVAAVLKIRFREPMNAEALFGRIIQGKRVVQDNYQAITSAELLEIKAQLSIALQRYEAAETSNDLSEMKKIMMIEIPQLQVGYTRETLRLGFPVGARKLPGLEGLFPGVLEDPETATD
jgi:hypothetical protein